jgi:hypothetical protein
VLELDDVDGGNRRAHRRDLAVGQNPNIVDAVGIERRDGAARGGPESNHDRRESAPVVARRSAELQGVDDRAVAGQLVVLVKDVQAKAAVGLPVVHRLPRDERQALVDGELGDLAVLHAVRPPPQHLSIAQLGEVGGLRLRKQHDIGLRHGLFAAEHRPDEGLELRIGNAEAQPVAALEDHARAQILVDALEVRRVNRHPPLVRLARGRHDAEAQQARGGVGLTHSQP